MCVCVTGGSEEVIEVINTLLLKKRLRHSFCILMQKIKIN